jgi:NitT/TauT family transport system permease protein
VIILGGLWELIKVVKNVSDARLPHTWQVLRYFFSDTSQGQNELVFLLHNIGVTLKEAAVGLVLALSVGLVLGVLIAKWPLFGRSVTPLLVLTQTLPLVAIAPALVIWLGQGWQAKAIIAALLAFFPVAVSVARGINDITVDQRAVFRSFGSTKRDVLVHLELPCALSQANAAVQTAAALAVVGAIVAELPAGTENGIAVVLLTAAEYYTYQPAALWCAAIIAALAGVAMVYLSRAVFSVVVRAALQTRVLPSSINS